VTVSPRLFDRAGASIDHLRALVPAERRGAGRTAPSPPTFDRVGGHLEGMRGDRLSFVLQAFQRGGDVARLRLGWLTAHLLAHPDHIRHVLVDGARDYDKQTRGFDKVRLILGNGLLTSEGDFWRRQRRIAQPAFHRERIAGFAAVMARVTEEMLADWAKRPAGSVLDVAEEMTRLALRIAGLTLLSTDPSSEADVVGRAVSLLLASANERILSPFDFLEALPTPKNLALRRAQADLDRVVYGAIAARRRSAERPSDLLSLFMDARDEDTGEAMSDVQLRDEVMTMFLAGHETTASTLAWAFWMMSLHPGPARAVVEEAQRVLGAAEAAGRAPTAEDVAAMPVTRRFLMETMRLYPPAWFLARRATKDDAIGGFAIPRGSYVFISPWVTHRHPALFEDPEGFYPERFEGEAASRLPKHAYIPFGAGPRVCIGQGFAMLEATLVLGMVARRFRLDVVSGHRVIPEASITLRPRDGVKVRLERA
jgi:cytochrome P450